MPVVSTTAYDQAEDALNLARSLANDAAGAVFSDAVLLPFLNSAYRALQRELAESGVSVLVSQADVDLPLTNGVTNTIISDVTTPQLPTDLLAPPPIVRTDNRLKRHFHAYGKNHWRPAKFSAGRAPAHVGVARRRHSARRRYAGNYGPHSLRKVTAGNCSRH